MGNKNTRTPKELYFLTSDHTKLFYRYWPATLPSKIQKVAVLFHRGHEHSGRLQHIVDELDMQDTTFYAWDARGHGRSPGKRGYSPSFSRSVQDVDDFIRFIVNHSQVPIENIVIIAQSLGAVMAATWVHDYAPSIRGLLLISPAFKVKLYVPFARPFLALAQHFKGVFFVNSYVKAKYLTHDLERIESFNKDPLITKSIAVNILLDLYITAERIIHDANAITIPTQVLISGKDYVVHRQPQINFYEKLRSPMKELHILPNFYHDTLGEKNRVIAFEKMCSFINKLYTLPPQRFDYSKDNYQNTGSYTWQILNSGPEPYSLEDIVYRGLRYSMKLFGKQSTGLTLGFKTGFDSGSTLDYVYHNQPQGRNLLGRMIDKFYLNNIGWRGIRQRKINLEKLIKQAATQLIEQNKTIRVVDIAAGYGRYVIDALEYNHEVNEILLRDYDDINIIKGQKMITARGMGDRARFERGDAFNREELASMRPRPTLAIVSGLYELFPDNTLVRQSLAGLADAIEPEGFLIYTNQPWHPQLKMIAWSLTSHKDGKAWIMRVRTQEEMDSLVQEAGFKKCTQLIDRWGIFTVSLAIR